jgi:hypothetical protein
MNLVQIFDVHKIWIKLENLKNNSRPTTGFSAQPSSTVPMQPACATPAQPASSSPGVAHRTGDGTWPTANQRWCGPCGGRGGSAPRAGVSAIGEVGRGRRLGQHSFMGNSIEASRGGVGFSAVVAARQRSAPVLGWRCGGWHRWSGKWAPGHRGGARGWSSGTGAHGRPLKARGAIAFDRCVVSTCPTPSDRWAQVEMRRPIGGPRCNGFLIQK